MIVAVTVVSTNLSNGRLNSCVHAVGKNRGQEKGCMVPSAHERSLPCRLKSFPFCMVWLVDITDCSASHAGLGKRGQPTTPSSPALSGELARQHARLQNQTREQQKQRGQRTSVGLEEEWKAAMWKTCPGEGCKRQNTAHGSTCAQPRMQQDTSVTLSKRTKEEAK